MGTRPPEKRTEPGGGSRGRWGLVGLAWVRMAFPPAFSARFGSEETCDTFFGGREEASFDRRPAFSPAPWPTCLPDQRTPGRETTNGDITRNSRPLINPRTKSKESTAALCSWPVSHACPAKIFKVRNAATTRGGEGIKRRTWVAASKVKYVEVRFSSSCSMDATFPHLKRRGEEESAEGRALAKSERAVTGSSSLVRSIRSRSSNQT